MSYLFAAIFFGTPLLTLIWWWWADRLLSRAKSASGDQTDRKRSCGWSWARTSVAAFGVAFFVGFAWIMLGRLRPDLMAELGLRRVPAPWLMGLLMLWALIVLPLLAVPSMVLWAAGQLLRTLLRTAQHLLRRAGESASENLNRGDSLSEAPFSRRQLLTGTLATAPVWVTVGLTGAGLLQRRHFRIRELTLEIPSLPAALDGVTIAHVSDTHVGKFTRGEILNRIADATNDLAADLVLMTGDLLDHGVHDLPDAVRMLDRIDRRSGLFLIEGNHDLFDGRAAFAGGLRETGYDLLLDEAATIRLRGWPVQILGSMWHGRDGAMSTKMQQLAQARDPQAFPILLAHHPHAFDQAAALGLPLTLAGHTHGGQLMLTPEFGIGPAIFNYWSGIYAQGANQLVVSNGAGNWFPVRTSAPAEILRVTLRAASG